VPGSWLLQFAALVVGLFALGLCAMAIRDRTVKRTLGNWRGRGRRKDLQPEQVAVLLAAHPGTVLALLIDRLRSVGRLAADFDLPIRLTPAPDGVREPLEEALCAAIDEAGALSGPGALGALEALWRDLDGAMAGLSGPATARYYRAFLGEMWSEATRHPDLPEGSEPWLALADPMEVWDSMGEGPRWERLKGLFREAGRLQSYVVTGRLLSEAAARAEKGYLAWRKDLVVVERRGVQPYR
jgi:hypothetical protein